MSDSLTIESLSTVLGREVPDIVLTVAKSSVIGLDPATIAEAIGIPEQEIHDLVQTQDYKDVRLLVGAEAIKEKLDRDMGWDGIESVSVNKLAQRLKFENDTEILLKIAAVANRAQRRAKPAMDSPLDPSRSANRVPLTLTRRFTEKLNGAGQATERTEIRQISVLDGSAVNPSFTEVNQILDHTPNPEGSMGRAAHASDFDFDDLDKIVKGIKNGI